MEKIIAGIVLLGTMSGISTANADITNDYKSFSNLRDTYEIKSVLFELGSVYGQEKKCD